jgi:hypothetical protein
MPVLQPPIGPQDDSDDGASTLSALTEDEESPRRGTRAPRRSGVKRRKVSGGKGASAKGKERAKEDAADGDGMMPLDDC